MKKSLLPDQSHQGDKRKKRVFSLTRIGILLIAVTIAIGLGTVVFSQSSKQNRMKSPKTTPQSRNQKTYVATQEINVDAQTGKLRKPTAEETRTLVENLKS